MTSDSMTASDHDAELMKLAKALAIKAAQIIIQSRDGSKAHTKCKPNSTDHAPFNMAFQEMLDVDKEAKKVLNSAHNDRWSLCVEIFLKTIEDDIMMLENWNISLIPDCTDNSKLCTLYGRLTILLKSLLAITRVIPAYRYSRRQNPDSWCIGHRMYVGEPICNSLGDKSKELKVGSVYTPIGLLQMSVAYRTSMTFSPQPSGISHSIVWKSDHFRPDFSPKPEHRILSSEDIDNKSLVCEEEPKIGAFVDSGRESIEYSDSNQLIPTEPFGSLLSTRTIQEESSTNAISGNELCERLKAIELEENDANENTPVSKTEAAACNDDFIVVDIVKPAFAEPSGNVKLGSFYREWKASQSMEAFCADPEVIDLLGDDLVSQLECYEISLEELDCMVKSSGNERTDSESENLWTDNQENVWTDSLENARTDFEENANTIPIET